MTELFERQATSLALSTELLVVFLLAMLGFEVGGRGANIASLDRLKRNWIFYLALALLGLLPFANVWVTANPALQWDMPTWLQIHYLQVYWTAIAGLLGYIFGLCCGAAFAGEKEKKWIPVIIAIVSFSMVQACAMWKSRTNTLPVLDKARVSSDGVILQTCDATCVPASAANIARLLGVRTSEAELARLLNTRADGTCPAQTLVGLRCLGISGRKVTISSREVHTVNAPAILFFLEDTHAVVFVGMTNGLAEIWNPAVGKTRMPESRLRDLWTGHALEFWRESQ